MATVLANRKSVDEVVSAFFEGRSKRSGLREGGRVRYSTDGESVYIWGNEVARWLSKTEPRIELTDAGWHSVITKQMLNAILSASGSLHQIGQERRMWFVYDIRNRAKRHWTGREVLDVRTGALVPARAGENPRRKKKTFVAGSEKGVRGYGVMEAPSYRWAVKPGTYRTVDQAQAAAKRMAARTPGSAWMNPRRKKSARRNLHAPDEREHAISEITVWLHDAKKALRRHDRERFSLYLGKISGVREIAAHERPRARNVVRHADDAIRTLKHFYKQYLRYGRVLA